MWNTISFPCHFYSLLLLSGWHYNNIHTWHRFIYFRFLMLRWFLMIFSVRLGQLFRKPCLIGLRRIGAIGLKSDAWVYCSSSGLVVWGIMLFYTNSDCCVSMVTSHITVCLFLVHFIICCTFFTDISCFYIMMVHPSSHRTPNDISASVLIFEDIWICLACFLRTGIWSVAICDESIVLPYVSLAVF